MITTTCLVLEASDFTRDANLKAEAFAAFITASVVVHGNRVVKSYVPGEPPVDLVVRETVEASAPRRDASRDAQTGPAAQPRQRAFRPQETVVPEVDPDSGEEG